MLIFFSLSTNQEYYTFPVYLPLVMLTAAALAHYERHGTMQTERRWIAIAHAALTVVGVATAAALCYGLWSARHLPFIPDIGDLLAHRGVGNYTLSMSHFFDLTGPSFAALRLPAAMAAVAFACGPGIAWRLRALGRHRAATSAVALTAAVFLIAAHIALVRFEPMLSSRDFADEIQSIDRNAEVYLYGDQSYGSSIPFYTGRTAYLVNGRTSSMIWGSTYADAPECFLTGNDLLARCCTGERKFLFVPREQRDAVDVLFATRPDLHPVLLDETSGKALMTDRNRGRSKIFGTNVAKIATMRSVLLIDDDAMSRELFTLLLEAEGYAVRVCENGDAALALLRADKTQPDAVLSDMQMPGITGTALAQAVRALCPRSVMIGMSASQPCGIPAGFDAFLLKPFDGAQFTQALQAKPSAKTAASTASVDMPDLDEAIAAPLAAAMPPKQLAALYALSLSDTRKRAATMQQSLAAGDDHAFRREAHAIKGSAGMLGAAAMAELARQMEEAGISGDAPRLLDDLIAAAARLEGILLLRMPSSTNSTTEPR